MPKEAADEPGATDPHLSPETWDIIWEATGQARDRLRPHPGWTSPPGYIRDTAGFRAGAGICELGIEFGRWSHCLEETYAIAYQIPAECRRKYAGRGLPRELRLRKLPTRYEGIRPVDPVARWWSSVAAAADALRVELEAAAGGSLSAKGEQAAKFLVGESRHVPAKGVIDLENTDHAAWAEWLRRANTLGAGDAAILAGALREVNGRAQRGATQLAIAGFTSWVTETAVKGIGAIHRMVKDRARAENEIVGTGGISTQSPAEAMEAKRGVWAPKWTALDPVEEEKRFSEAMADARAAASEADLPERTIENLDRCLKCYSPGTGRGIDNLGPLDVARAPNKAKADLLTMFDAMLRRCSVPWQLLAVIMVLIQKPAGGDRAIGLEAFLIRLLGRMCNEEILTWTQSYEEVAFWDRAIRGSSALRTALTRLFLEESAELLGCFSIDASWDIKEFYDSIRPSDGIRAALAWSYPPQLLAICGQIWTASRLLRDGSAFALPIAPTCSVVAGDGSSGNVAKSFVGNLLGRIHRGYMPKGIAAASWIDDVNQRGEGTREGTLASMKDACVEFGHGVQEELKMVISPKSVVTCADAAAAQELVAHVQAHGIPLNVSDEVADLGIERGPRRTRRTKHGTRVRAANRSFAKLRRLAKGAKVRAVAKRVGLTGSLAKMRHGCQGSGASPDQTTRARRALGALVPGHRAGSCLTTALNLEVGDKDPGIAFPTSVVRNWFEGAGRDETSRRRAAAAWPHAWVNITMAKAAGRWAQVKGIISGVIFAMSQLGWGMMEAERWIHPSGDAYAIRTDDDGEVEDTAPFLEVVRESARVGLWRGAAKHHLGGGLEGGADTNQLKRHIRGLEKRGLHQWAGAIRCCATGGVWGRERLAAANPGISPICQRCDLNVPESDFHRAWECPANASLDVCAASDGLIDEAGANAAEWPCFYLRGLIPASWTEVPEPPLVCTEEDIPDGKGVFPMNPATPLAGGEGIKAVGDASGGDQSSDSRVRRIGWAAVVVARQRTERDVPLSEEAIRDAAVFGGGLPGPRQTVNRGELLAVIRAAERAADAGYAWLHHVPAVRGASRPPARPLGPNRDLWKRFGKARARIEIRISKIESHREDFQVIAADPVLTARFLGNCAADAYAGEWASDVAVPKHVKANIDLVESKAYRIQRRLAGTLLDAVDKDRDRPKDRTPAEGRVPRKERIRAALSESEHRAQAVRGGWTCTLCGGRCNGKSVKDIVSWARSSCLPALPVHDRLGDPRTNGRVEVGNRVIHRSHITYFRSAIGYHYCGVCGAVGSNSIKLLAEPCGRELTADGATNLRRLREGLCPGASAAARAYNRGRLHAPGRGPGRTPEFKAVRKAAAPKAAGHAWARQLQARRAGAAAAARDRPGPSAPSPPPAATGAADEAEEAEEDEEEEDAAAAGPAAAPPESEAADRRPGRRPGRRRASFQF